MKSVSKKVFVTFLALIMCLSVGLAFTQKTNAFAASEYDTDLSGRDAISREDYEGLTNQIKILQINSALETWEERYLKYQQQQTAQAQSDAEKKAKSKESDRVKAFSGVVSNINKELPGIISDIKKVINGNGESGTASIINSLSSLNDALVSVTSSLLPLADMAMPGVGSLCAGVLNLRHQIFKTIMGGEAATSEMAQMEDRLNQQFDEIQNKLSDIEEQISDISNQINESTEKIINATVTALDNADAKQYLRAFMLSSGKRDFSYNQYHNFIYGSTINNADARTAYNAKLKAAIANGASDSIIKSHYDKLYEELTGNQDILRDYIKGSDSEDSIVKAYYKTVSANGNLLKATGDSPEVATIKFAYDLYQTYIEADMTMLGCNIYQYRTMLETGADSYYTNNENILVSIDEIQNNVLLDTIVTGEEEIYKCIVRDLAQICGMTDSYVLESNGKFYEITNNENTSFGNITSEQIVYLNGMPESVCKLFGFNANDFVYCLNGEEFDGIIKNLPDGRYTLGLKYVYDEKKSIDIGSLNFTVSDGGAAALGSGTIEDPMLIENKEQFLNIKNDLKKHYKLIGDIDFNGAEISPIGYSLNSNYSESYKEFTGSLDGNGFKLQNLNIVGESYSGLFAKIGSKGVVKNLTLENVKASATIDKAKSTVSNYYIGSVCGANNGTISNCEILSNNNDNYGVFFEVNNAVHNRNITVYAGGVSGINNGYISACKIESISVKGTSVHDFGGDATSTNKNAVYVGGLTGINNAYIGYSAVLNTVKLNAYAKSIYNPQKAVNPYVTSFAGGICAQENNNYRYIEKIFTGIDVANISAVSELDCQSNWGRYYDNVKTEKSAYIPYMSETIKNTVSLSFAEMENVFGVAETEFTLEYKNGKGYCEFDNATSCFNMDGVVLNANGQAIDAENIAVVRVYNFNGFNTEFNKTDVNTAVVLLLVRLNNGQRVLTKQSIQYTVGANEIQSIEIIGAKTTFYTEEENVINKAILGATVKLTKTVGTENITINANNINEFSVKDLDVSTAMDFTKIGDKKETRTYTVTYNGVESNAIEYIVLCIHCLNEKEYLHITGEPVAATCVSRGYTVYHCNECDCNVYKNYTPIDPYAHKIAYEDSRDATCYEEGYIGRIYCERKLCGHTFEEGYTIPKKSHVFTKIDDIYHGCENEKEANGTYQHYEAHQYTITESVEHRNIDGVWQDVLIYNYVCQGCGYKKEVVDINTKLAENNNLPKVVVTQGYALHGGDEVVVYVQLVNNPGILGAHFGIRYDEGLTLINWEDGPVLEKSMIANSSEVDNGCNFVWANGSTRDSDGNLLKLTFKMPYEYQENQIFKIWVVYDLSSAENDPFNGKTSINLSDFNDNYNADGGFATSKGTQLFVTEAGSITFVKHLPGDINNDGVVDILDAVILGKDLVKNKEEREIEKDIGDLNLNNGVGIDDLVSLLIHLTGGYNENGVYAVLNPTYRLILNLNGAELSELKGNKELQDLIVSVYGDESGKTTYADFDLKDLERYGYKFLGWYDKPVDGSKVDIKKDNVTYNRNQKVQTLYAHWQINHITFNGNGATSEQIETIYYHPDVNEEIKDDDVKQEYLITFLDQISSIYHQDGITGNQPQYKKLTYEIIYWEDKNNTDNKYSLDKSITQYIDADGKVICLEYIDLSQPNLGWLELQAIWDSGSLDYALDWEFWGYQEELTWYKRNPSGNFDIGGDGNPYRISSIDDFEVLKNLALAEGKKTDGQGEKYYGIELCAEFTKITYTIVFNSNGAQWSWQPHLPGTHTIEYDAPIPSTAARTGYVFTGWIDNYGNSYDDGATVGYIDGVEQGETVTFTAQWEAINFAITFNGNYGNVSEYWNNDYKLPPWNAENAVYDQEDNLQLPSVSVADNYGLIFKGWDTSDDGTGRYTSGQKLVKEELNKLYTDRTLTLYAVWEVNPYTVSSSVTKNGTNVSDSWTGGKTYKVYKNEFPRWANDTYQIIDVRDNDCSGICTDLYGETWIIGNLQRSYQGQYFCFAEISEGHTRTVHLQDFNFTSSTTVGALCTYSGNDYNNCNGGNIVIDIKGNCSISMSSAGGNAVMLTAQNISIIGNGSLIMKAGNGANGASAGASGSDGGIGIISNNITVDMKGSLTVYGGNGGNGAIGGNGNPGVRSGWINTDGEPGTKGYAGGNGGNGARAVELQSKLIVNRGDVILVGGSGGQGGQGGNGADHDGWFRGTPGGDGGVGGQGGNGNKAISSSTIISVNVNSYYLAINGNGGRGGKGGTAGKGGSSGLEKGWAPGIGGTGGRGGNGNIPGEGGHGGDGNYDGNNKYVGSSGSDGPSGSINFYDGDRTYVDGSGIVVYGYNTLSNNEFLKGGSEKDGRYAVYDNNHKGVTIENISRSSDNRLGLPYEMKITSKLGSDNRHMGGYYGAISSSANAVFYYTIYAKIPVGYSIGMYNNSIGDGAKVYWLTDNKGTGRWQWYIGVTECGSSGTFDTLGFVAIYQNDECQDLTKDDVLWYVGYSNIVRYQATSVDNTETINITEYNGHKYQLVTGNYTWEEAKTKAEELGGHLVIITSAEENAVVKQLVINSGVSTVWLGATDKEVEDEWKWITGEDFTYSDWGKIDADSSEPNGGTSENYLTFLTGYTGGNRIAWNDAGGTGKYSFIVEFDSIT